MNNHDRYFSAQIVHLTPRESPGFRTYGIPARQRRRSRIPAFVAGVAVGLALGLAWAATAGTIERHVGVYERHTTEIPSSPCLDRAHLALSVAQARLAGVSRGEAVDIVRKAAREAGRTAHEVANMTALVNRVWAQRDKPEAAFIREFEACTRSEVGV